MSTTLVDDASILFLFFYINLPTFIDEEPKIDYFLPQKFKKWASMFSKCFHEHSEHQKSRLFKRLFDILYTIRTQFCVLLNPYNIYIIWSFTQLLPALFYIPNLFLYIMYSFWSHCEYILSTSILISSTITIKEWE